MFAVHYITYHMSLVAEVRNAADGDKVTESLRSVKGRSDFALGFCLRSVINPVICTSLSPPLFLSSFFLFFHRFRLERVQVVGRFLLLLSDARLHPS